MSFFNPFVQYDSCVCCGAYVPEGRMVCQQCEKDPLHDRKERELMNKTRCRGCGAEIEWVKTSNGSSMPVNPEYIEIDIAGPKSMRIVTDDGRVESGGPVNPDNLFPPDKVIRGRLSHFATCPQANKFKR